MAIIHHFFHDALSDFHDHVHAHETFAMPGADILRESSLYSIEAGRSALCGIDSDVC